MRPEVGNGASGRRRRGFTLIELLVVIAVITILASLALPVVTRAVASGQNANCKSNLHQIGVAFTNYVGQNHGVIPMHDDVEVRVIDQGMWWRMGQGHIIPDLQDWRVFECRSDEGLSGQLGVPRWFSYGYNTNLWTGNSWRPLTYKNLSDMKYPSEYITYLDHTEPDGGVDGNDDRGYQPNAVNNPKMGLQRHNGGFNAVFMDGHVRWYEAGQTEEKNYDW